MSYRICQGYRKGRDFKRPQSTDQSTSLRAERSMENPKAARLGPCVMCFDECPAWPGGSGGIAEVDALSMRLGQTAAADGFWRPSGLCAVRISKWVLNRIFGEESAKALIEWVAFDGLCRGRSWPWARAGGDVRLSGFFATDMVPVDRRAILMGLGKTARYCGSCGVALIWMDCVLPSRSGVRGRFFHRHGVVNIESRHAERPGRWTSCTWRPVQLQPRFLPSCSSQSGNGSGILLIWL